MQSWEEYIKSNIIKFRELYSSLDKQIQEVLKKRVTSYTTRLNKPTQVVVITFTSLSEVVLLIANSKKFPDMDITVYPNMDFEDFWEKDEIEKSLIELFGENGVDFIKEFFKPIPWSSPPLVARTKWNDSVVFLHYGYDPRERAYFIAEDFYCDVDFQRKNMEREIQSKKIESTMDDIKRVTEAIPESVNSRTELIEKTKGLEKQIEEQNKKYEEDFSALRKLIGTEEHVGWKTICSDIKNLKDTHLNKEVFDAHIKRLDEKIEKGIDNLNQKTEKGFDALNTRFEDLKAIKFWSKRTLLEIALAGWGAFLTLYVAGIIKF